MRIADFEIAATDPAEITLPLVIEQTVSVLPSTLALLATAPLAALLLVPGIAILGAGGLGLAGGALAVVLMLASLVLIAWPARRIAERLGRRRSIRLDRGVVRVDDAHTWSGETWQAPIASYLGLAHHIRSNLSGARHELILVHPDPRRSVLLATAERFTRADVDGACRTLGVLEVPPSLLYRPLARRPNVVAPTTVRPAAVAEDSIKAEAPLQLAA